MSWFRSSRRRRSAEPAEAPAGPPRPHAPASRTGPLADLHELAAQWEVPRFRLLRRAELIDAISGEERRPRSRRPQPRRQSAARQSAAGAGARAASRSRSPSPSPSRRPTSRTEGELRTGILDLVGEGYGFVRVGGLTRSPEDPYVSRTLVREYSLRRGDEVTGRVVPRRAGERHGRMVTRRVAYPGEAPPVSFDDCPVQRPTRPLRAQPGADAFGAAHGRAGLAPGHRAARAWSPARRARARHTCCARWRAG